MFRLDRTSVKAIDVIQMSRPSLSLLLFQPFACPLSHIYSLLLESQDVTQEQEIVWNVLFNIKLYIITCLLHLLSPFDYVKV